MIEELSSVFDNLKIMWMVNTDIADRTQSEDTYLLYGRITLRLMYGITTAHGLIHFPTNPTQARNWLNWHWNLQMLKSRTYDRSVLRWGTFSLPFAARVKISRLKSLSHIESAKRNVE